VTTTSSASAATSAGGRGTTYYGKYRATVINNVDPMLMGRIQVIVPDVSQVLPSSWAMPCVPVAGIQMGAYLVPPMGAGVWVEFEQGDPDYPIWVGCFWGTTADVPAVTHLTPPGVDQVVVQTTLQTTLVVSDLPGPTGGIMLKSTTGAMLIVNDTGIYLDNGQGATITLVGPTVAVNIDGLVVT
jgi:hypothetical protein